MPSGFAAGMIASDLANVPGLFGAALKAAGASPVTISQAQQQAAAGIRNYEKAANIKPVTTAPTAKTRTAPPPQTVQNAAPVSGDRAKGAGMLSLVPAVLAGAGGFMLGGPLGAAAGIAGGAVVGKKLFGG